MSEEIWRQVPAFTKELCQRGVIVRMLRWNAKFLRLMYRSRSLARNSPLGVEVSLRVLFKSAGLAERQAVRSHLSSDERGPIGAKIDLKHGISYGRGTGLRLRQRVRPAAGGRSRHRIEVVAA